MSSLYNLVRNENMKIYRRPRTWAMIGILILALALVGGIIQWDESKREPSADWKQDIARQNQHIQNNLESEGANFTPEDKLRAENEIKLNNYYLEQNLNPQERTLWNMVDISSSMIILVAILTVIVAADMIAAEFSWGTIKLLLVGPASRTKIMLSKYLATLWFAVFLLVVCFLAAFALGAVFEGMDGLDRPYVTIGADGNVQEGSMLLHILQTYGYKVVELIMYVTFAFMVSAAFRSSSMAIAFSLLFMLLGNMIVQMLSGYEWVKYILFANVDLSQYVSGSPIRPEMTMLFSIGMLLAYYVLFQFIAWLLFTKRDVAG
ncbi:ABC transporter permease [Paenibacillus sp. J2TS4]|uniref:ABC transporter permease n=1 Tax=Paenibacillus sp. J2TS4 TaxID=2807194 RepID=UPI001B145AAD|nr:ABC transporter permease [Paenibacillus sp. J2TS4]GIP34489.1 hypothetical protein J2TS4_36990 [Paenibacillus sp. J2TS4]